jgi:hypothetical protein
MLFGLQPYVPNEAKKKHTPAVREMQWLLKNALAHQFSEAIFSHESREENYKARRLASYATTLEVGRSVCLIHVSLPKWTPRKKGPAICPEWGKIDRPRQEKNSHKLQKKKKVHHFLNRLEILPWTEVNHVLKASSIDWVCSWVSSRNKIWEKEPQQNLWKKTICGKKKPPTQSELGD